jgi:hypothetical protein
MRIVTPASAPAAELKPKLPLLTRKDIRDAFDSQLPRYTQTIHEYLKDASYKVEVDFSLIYSHCLGANVGTEAIGSHAATYLESFVDNLKQYTEEVSYSLISNLPFLTIH